MDVIASNVDEEKAEGRLGCQSPHEQKLYKREITGVLNSLISKMNLLP